MSHVLDIASREIHEHRRIYAAALALGFLPVVLPRLWPSQDPSEVRGLFLLVLLSMFLLAAGALGGATTLASDLAQRRSGFWFSRPVGGFGLWAGKMLGTLGLGILALPPLVLPTLLLGGDLPGYEWSTLLGIVAGAFVLLVIVGHALGIALRSRSGWLLVDLVAASATLFLAYRAWKAVSEGAAETWVAVAVLVFLTVPLLALAAGGALAIAHGRTDIRRAHRVLSLVTWSVTGIALAALLGWLGWARSAGPGALATIEWVVPAPRGEFAFVRGQARGFLHSFLLDLEPGTAAPDRAARASGSQGGAVVRTGEGETFSGDGTVAAWIEWDQQVGRSDARVAWARIDGPAPVRIETKLSFRVPLWPRLHLSNDGRLLAVVHGEQLSIFELASEKSLFETRLPDPPPVAARGGQSIRAARFVTPERFRFYRVPTTRHSAGSESQIWEVDLAGRRLQQIGTLPVWTWTLLLSPDASRLSAAPRAGDGARVALHDAVSGAELWSRAVSGIPGTTARRFLSDGTLVVAERRDGRATLTLVSPAGGELRSFDLGAWDDGIRLGGEVAPGQLAVGFGWPAPGSKGPSSVAIVDLATGTVLRREQGLTPLFWLASFFGGTEPGAGSLANRLFRDGDAHLVALDPATGERRRLLPPRL